jgi:hypothetical protein
MMDRNAGMERSVDTVLKTALSAAALGSLITLALMLTSLFVPVRWNWYNALAFFGATACLAGARFLHRRVMPIEGSAVKTMAI